MVARLTPDQKVACSIHVGFNPPNYPPEYFTVFDVTSCEYEHQKLFYDFGISMALVVVFGSGHLLNTQERVTELHLSSCYFILCDLSVSFDMLF